jgi:hypothetical protein
MFISIECFKYHTVVVLVAGAGAREQEEQSVLLSRFLAQLQFAPVA